MSKEKSLEEYLSGIKHDLRRELAPIRELISIVLDGPGNKDCAKCFGILKPALGSADRLNKLTEELFSASAFNFSGNSLPVKVGIRAISCNFCRTSGA